MVLAEGGLCVPSNPKRFYFYENEQKLSGYILQASLPGSVAGFFARFSLPTLQFASMRFLASAEMSNDS